jgi:hypothetical protein
MSKATDQSTNTNPSPQMTPDGLTELARRLRNHADSIQNHAATGADMTAAAVVIEGIVKLHADIHIGEQTNVVQGVLRLIGATRITLDLPSSEAMALAQFLTRLTFEDCTRYAAPSITYGERPEADVIWQGVLILQRGLAEAGYAPR